MDMDVLPKRTTYKYCLVPTCSATTIKNPSKRFISVPLREPRRSAWLTAIRYFGNISSKTHHHVCEDHFNLEEDADNYTKLTFFPESRVVLKAHVIPHIFECHPSEPEEQPVQEQLPTIKAQSSLHKNPFFSLTKRSSSTTRSAASWSKKWKKPVVVVKVEDSDSNTPFLSNEHSPKTVLPYKLSITSGTTDCESDSGTSSQTEVPPPKVVIPAKQLTSESHLNVKDFSKYSKTRKRRKSRLKQEKTSVLEKETQTDFEKCSIGVLARPLIRSEFVQCDLSSQKIKVDTGTSP